MESGGSAGVGSFVTACVGSSVAVGVCTLISCMMHWRYMLYKSLASGYDCCVRNQDLRYHYHLCDCKSGRFIHRLDHGGMVFHPGFNSCSLQSHISNKTTHLAPFFWSLSLDFDEISMMVLSIDASTMADDAVAVLLSSSAFLLPIGCRRGRWGGWLSI
jgi:hypothetical protein